jgi:hypothetical protein
MKKVTVAVASPSTFVLLKVAAVNNLEFSALTQLAGIFSGIYRILSRCKYIHLHVLRAK